MFYLFLYFYAVHDKLFWPSQRRPREIVAVTAVVVTATFYFSPTRTRRARQATTSCISACRVNFTVWYSKVRFLALKSRRFLRHVHDPRRLRWVPRVRIFVLLAPARSDSWQRTRSNCFIFIFTNGWDKSINRKNVKNPLGLGLFRNRGRKILRKKNHFVKRWVKIGM